MVFGPGNLQAQVGICSKTYPITPFMSGSDHYVYVRYRRDESQPVPPAVRNTLRALHDGCLFPAVRDNHCQAAIHRFVAFNGHGDGGVSQEVGDGYIVMAGFPGTYSEISVNELRGHHGGCTFPYAQSNECTAAIHRACNARGFTAGFSQEVGDQVYGVACFNASWVGEAQVE